MAKDKRPELCKNCKLYDKNSTYCTGYALRVAVNDFKKCFTDISDALFNCKTEYDYECFDYLPKDGDV